MATNNANQKIVNSWSLLAYAHSVGAKKCKIATCKDKAGEQFKSVALIDSADNISYVGFSQNLGVLSPEELAERQYDLRVVELESGNKYLCEPGESTWQDVALDL